MATELCNQANEEYVNENYNKAVELYTEALQLDDKRDDIYCHRAQSYIQLEKFSEAAKDCDKAIELNENNNKAYFKKGSALYKMNKFGEALNVFKEGHKRFESDKNFEEWINKCQEKLPKSDSQDAKPKSNESIAQPVENQAPAGPPKLKYDWYQTSTHVVVNILMKNIKQENLTVDSADRQLKIEIKDPRVSLDLTLAHRVDSQQTTIKVLSTKVEVKLKKGEGILWSKLEGDVEEEKICPVAAAPIPAEPPRYPSSSHHAKDWDKLAKQVTEEEKDEKLEGDAALNQFFQKIYADASDETKKAMMKSFTESGGTVLSTNWSEVGTKKVEVKPPDGMEFKKWEY
ncbi:protein SGT1 homolog [Physella acuta]|uniref:protein SGT1 homolog n=1 Tax=Physella acuta TaxID=109671 RepID=UPI0027DBF2B3|nr:protein SGT1 homolog [Physella acuta]